jgi:selenophosphate synthase
MPTNAQPGDKIIVTKPLGMRLAINAMQWLKADDPKNRNLILKDST